MKAKLIIILNLYLFIICPSTLVAQPLPEQPARRISPVIHYWESNPGVAFADTLMFVVSDLQGLEIYSVHDLSHPKFTHLHWGLRYFSSIHISEEVSVAYTDEWIQPLDLTNPFAPSTDITIGPGVSRNSLRDIVLRNSVAYCLSDSSLSVLDLHQPESPVWHADYQLDQTYRSIALGDSLIAVATQSGIIRIYSLASTLYPRFRHEFDYGGTILDICWIGHYLLVDRGFVVTMFDMSVPTLPRVLSSYTPAFQSNSIDSRDHLVYVGTEVGLEVVRVFGNQFHLVSSIEYPTREEFSVAAIGDSAVCLLQDNIGLTLCSLQPPGIVEHQTTMNYVNKPYQIVQNRGQVYVGGRRGIDTINTVTGESGRFLDGYLDYFEFEDSILYIFGGSYLATHEIQGEHIWFRNNLFHSEDIICLAVDDTTIIILDSDGMLHQIIPIEGGYWIEVTETVQVASDPHWQLDPDNPDIHSPHICLVDSIVYIQMYEDSLTVVKLTDENGLEIVRRVGPVNTSRQLYNVEEKLYSVTNHGLFVYDISNPENPVYESRPVVGNYGPIKMTSDEGSLYWGFPNRYRPPEISKADLLDNGEFELQYILTDLDFEPRDMIVTGTTLSAISDKEFATYSTVFRPEDEINERTVRNLLPRGSQLSVAYPNPFNRTTSVTISLSSREHVTLNLYNLLGQRIARVADRHFAPGEHRVSIDASYLASGNYYLTLQTQSSHEIRRITLLK